MKKKIVFIIVIVLLMLFFIPMQHGGTLGSNLFEGLIYELKAYFSPKAREERTKEEKELRRKKIEAKESWETFKRENPQYFPK